MFTLPRWMTWPQRFVARLEKFMSDTDKSFEDLSAANAVTDSRLLTLKTDIESILAKLAAIPIAGMTPAQQTALNDAVAHAKAVNDQLSGLDTEANPPAAAQPGA